MLCYMLCYVQYHMLKLYKTYHMTYSITIYVKIETIKPYYFPRFFHFPDFLFVVCWLAF